ncbi:MAG: AAA domain-containing protein [Candidatus Kapaibacterium sp.]
MIDKETAGFFLKQARVIIANRLSGPREKFLEADRLIRELMLVSVEAEPQLFPSYFAVSVYVADKYGIPKQMADYITHISYAAQAITKDETIRCTPSDVRSAALVIIYLVDLFSPGLVSQQEKSLIKNELSGDHKRLIPARAAGANFTAIIKGLVKKRDSSIGLEIISPEKGEVQVLLKGLWLKSYKVFKKGLQANFIGLRKSASGFEAGPDSYIVIDPENLIHVTDIAGCFQSCGNNPLLNLLGRFRNTDTSYGIVLGNLVNSMFDELIIDREIDFETAYSRAISYKPLQIFVLYERQREKSRFLKKDAGVHFESLKMIVQRFPNGKIHVEPAFLSPKFGMQGRLDAMIEYDSDPQRKDVIELKSGSAPKPDLTVEGENGKRYHAGMWNNHFAQVSCYNLLLDSVYPGRTGSSQLLYSAAPDEHPLRNAPNTYLKKAETVNTRNMIALIDLLLRQGKYAVLDKLNPRDIGAYPPYLTDFIIEFERNYKRSAEIIQDYFREFLTFIMNESYIEKTGLPDNNRPGGHNSLWRDSVDDKVSFGSLIKGLRFNEAESDAEKLHLTFDIDSGDLMASSIRQGDYIIIYRDEGSLTDPLKDIMMKAVIKILDNSQITVSLRNKQTDISVFGKYAYWIIEQDHSDSGTKKLISSLYSILNCAEQKQKILLGEAEPRFKPRENISDPTLNPVKLNLLRNAVSAEDYYLIQGPPGTGKTSYMLRAIVNYYYRNSDINILVCAYTNRAVDEICEVLNKAGIDYLRQGARETSPHKDKMISCLAANLSMKELYNRISETRIFISTAASLQNGNEIFELKKFRLAVIDEASQILEPQILSVLTAVDKFIMIGDEKQLPAVVSLSEEQSEVKSGKLKGAGLFNLRNSLFERLLYVCRKKHWNLAFGMLYQQGRMHMDIQEFPNLKFYGGKLETFPGSGWQNSQSPVFRTDNEDKLNKLLYAKRNIFIRTEKTEELKYNSREAALVSEIASRIYEAYAEKFTCSTLGIITPYRLQAYEIKKKLPPGLREMIDVETVERFQGSERDIIIISMAINYYSQLKNLLSLSVYNDVKVDRKMNVALTRAKHNIIMLGNDQILERSELYGEYIEYLKKKGNYMTETDFY